MKHHPYTVDAFGLSLRSYLNGESHPCILERDDGHTSTQPIQYYFSEYPDWSGDEKQALTLVKGKVLDIGAGAGRHSLWLQEQGYDVTAIDLSLYAVEVMKKRGVKDCRVMDALIMAPEIGVFDTVLLLGVNFGIGGDVESTKRLLTHLRDFTSPDAVILASSRAYSKSNNPEHISYQKKNISEGKFPGELLIRFKFKDKATDWFKLLIADPEDMRMIASEAGWEMEKIFNGPRGSYIGVLKKALFLP